MIVRFCIAVLLLLVLWRLDVMTGAIQNTNRTLLDIYQEQVYHNRGNK